MMRRYLIVFGHPQELEQISKRSPDGGMAFKRTVPVCRICFIMYAHGQPKFKRVAARFEIDKIVRLGLLVRTIKRRTFVTYPVVFQQKRIPFRVGFFEFYSVNSTDEPGDFLGN